MRKGLEASACAVVCLNILALRSSEHESYVPSVSSLVMSTTPSNNRTLQAYPNAQLAP